MFYTSLFLFPVMGGSIVRSPPLDLSGRSGDLSGPPPFDLPVPFGVWPGRSCPPIPWRGFRWPFERPAPSPALGRLRDFPSSRRSRHFERRPHILENVSDRARKC